METKRNGRLLYALLTAAWLLVIGWQAEEHLRVVEAARSDLRNRSHEIASTLGAVTRALKFRGAVFQDRLEPVLNELVNQRTNELGLRMALGCAPGGVVRLVLVRAMALAAAGLLAGLGLSVAAARGLATLLVGVRPTDAWGYAAAALAIAAVTFGAALAPAWRASRIDPAVALRGD